MPKFLVTRDSYFEPLSYEELVRPVEHMQQAHNAAQDIYDTLTMETSALENYISDNPDDVRARKMYDDYKNKLASLQNNLWKNGISAQTRRDLSTARAGYASDITRLTKAIQSRQERSKAYWDMKHNHPDLVMGADPGASGLDRYLEDDMYGQNYYTYSGTQFMNEVAADAKARVNEMLRMPQYMNNPQAAGYLMRISQDGYTSQEVQEASAAVRAAIANETPEIIANMQGPSGILANVLMSHLNSTGAQGQVSPEEFGRLVDYGSAGLSQAIGKASVTDLNDKVWDYNKQVSLANMRGSTGGKKGKEDEEKPIYDGHGYALNAIVRSISNSDYDTLHKSAQRSLKNFGGEPIEYALPDGTSATAYNNFDLGRQIYNPQSRKDARITFNGLDIALLDNGQTVTKVGNDGTEHTYTVKKLSAEDAEKAGVPKGSYGLIQENGVVNIAGTKKLNEYVADYDNHVNSYDKELRSKAYSPKDEAKWRKDNNINPMLDSDFVESVATTRAKVGNYTDATVAASDDSWKPYRNNLLGTMRDTFYRYKSEHGGKVKQSDPVVFKRITSGGSYIVTDIDKVVGDKDKDNMIASASLPMENIIYAARHGGIPDIRFLSNYDNNVYDTNAAMFGSLLYNTLAQNTTGLSWNVVEHNLGIKSPRQNARNFNEADVMYCMLEPLNNPQEVMMMTPEQEQKWMVLMSQLMSYTGTDGVVRSYIPMIHNAGRPASPKEIVVNPDLQEQLYNAYLEYSNTLLGEPRDMINTQPMQTMSESSTKPYTFNGK